MVYDMNAFFVDEDEKTESETGKALLRDRYAKKKLLEEKSVSLKHANFNKIIEGS